MGIYYIGNMPISDDLYHHGIRGQKWGVRRYQNPDGTLTNEGKERYGTVENFEKKEKHKIERGVALLDKNRSTGGTIGRAIGRQALISLGATAAASALSYAMLNSSADATKFWNMEKTLSKIATGSAVIGAMSLASVVPNTVKAVKDYRAIDAAEKSGAVKMKNRL